LLAQADELERIVNLVGPEALSSAQRWVLESSGMIKEAVLQQSALDPVDSYCSPEKQFQLLDIVIEFYEDGRDLIKLGVPVEQMQQLPLIGQLKRLKSRYTSDELDKISIFKSELKSKVDSMRAEYSATPQEAVS
jgi:V/A-type H+-transporting ATPase subunit A